MARDTARSAGGIIAVKLRVALLGLCVALAFPARTSRRPEHADRRPSTFPAGTTWARPLPAIARPMSFRWSSPASRRDTADDTGQSPLGYAASFGNLEMAQALIKYGAPVDRARPARRHAAPLGGAARHHRHRAPADRGQGDHRRPEHPGHHAADAGGKPRPGAGGAAAAAKRRRSAQAGLHRPRRHRLGRGQAEHSRRSCARGKPG